MGPSEQIIAGETLCSDGTVIHHLESGHGPPLVLLPGWSQSAQTFRSQLTGLSRSWRTLAIDHRGHGASSEPRVGYHIHRLATDLHDVMATHALDEVHLLGHSMGCAVIWSYLELFGADRLRSLILVDQMPCAVRNPSWTDAEALEAGATMDFAGLFAFTDTLRDDGREDPRGGFLSDVTSDAIASEQLTWLVSQSGTFNRGHAADLIFDVATHDWRAFLPHITLPTLVIAGDSVNVPLVSQHKIADLIPDAQFACVTTPHGGTHFPFLESAEAFNAVLAAFLYSHRSEKPAHGELKGL